MNRPAKCMSIALVIFLASATLASAKEVGALTVSTDLQQNTAMVGQKFKISVGLNFQGVDPDDFVCIRLTPNYEPKNPSMTTYNQLTDPLGKFRTPIVHMTGCQDHSIKSWSGYFRTDFEVYFTEEIVPENLITIDAYVQTVDGRSIDFLDQYILKIKMIPPSRLEILDVDCPRPPDTVRVGEKVPIRVTVQCVSLLPDSEIKGSIMAVSGGSGLWTWTSPPLSGSSRYVSEPLELAFDQPGIWTLQATAFASTFHSDAFLFEVEVVDEPQRILGPVRISYPKPPDSVREGERVRFDVSMDCENIPPGTVAAIVFVDSATGEDLIQGWLSSRPLGGSGTYDFGPIVLTAPAPGTWELDATIRLPRLDAPEEYKTYYSKRISLQVLSETASPAWNPADMKAEITRIQKPQGTLGLNEVFPIFVTISYEKFGEQGAVLRADVTERGTDIFAGRGDSILLRDQGTYTLPAINVTAAHTGTFAIQVNIVGPNNRILATKWTDFTVVD